jgi:hypothetical protein
MELGGRDSKGVVGGPSPKRLGDAIRVDDIRIDHINDDLLIEGRIHS